MGKILEGKCKTLEGWRTAFFIFTQLFLPSYKHKYALIYLCVALQPLVYHQILIKCFWSWRNFLKVYVLHSVEAEAGPHART